MRDIEHAAFTPRVLSTSGGMGREATTFYKRLADLLSNKRNHPNPGLVLRYRLSFAVLRSCTLEEGDPFGSKQH